MDFATIRDRVSYYTNFNDSTTDQDFSTARINQAINIVYQDEVNRAQLEGSRKFFTKVAPLTWPASTSTLRLPANLAGKKLVRIEDVTDSDPGSMLNVGDRGSEATLFWLEHDQLQWGTSGPSSARTLRVVYVADIETLEDDDDVPSLIPPAFHNLIVWSAAVLLRQLGDEEAPQQWMMERENLRLDYWKHVSRGRMYDDEDWIRPRDSDYSNEGIF